MQRHLPNFLLLEAATMRHLQIATPVVGSKFGQNSVFQEAIRQGSAPAIEILSSLP